MAGRSRGYRPYDTGGSYSDFTDGESRLLPEGNLVLISASKQVGAEELALPVCRGCFFLIPLISVHFRHYSVIPAIPSWPLVQSRPAGKSGGCCPGLRVWLEGFGVCAGNRVQVSGTGGREVDEEIEREKQDRIFPTSSHRFPDFPILPANSRYFLSAPLQWDKIFQIRSHCVPFLLFLAFGQAMPLRLSAVG